MVSYYNPAAVAMFSRTAGSAHHHPHHHHSSPTQNHYFAPAYSSYHPHHHHHHQSAPPTPVGVTSAQFSPNMPTDFNCNHQYHHQFGNMTPDSMAAAASWHQPMYSACAARNIVHPAASGYEDWGHQHAHLTSSPATTAAATSHPSFYPHQQPSPPSSTPSPNSTHTAGHHSPNVYTSSTTNHSASFKTEFGPCSGGNPQENSSQEMQTQGPVVSSAGASISIGTPHSPDSGMAISDGVSSSGSPATGQPQNSQQQQQQQHCLGAASHHHLNSAVSNLNGAMLQGSQATNLNNLNQQQQQSLHSSRPAQARSPYEWMKKPSYSAGSNSGGECRKTRTKDKYRVVYSDTQRLELEKEFHYSRYITIRRKAELASILGLSERQVKIWFQNRRAKERKVVRKREEMINREKAASGMMHIHPAVAAAAGGMVHVSGGPMCNQNGNSVSLPQLM